MTLSNSQNCTLAPLILATVLGTAGLAAAQNDPAVQFSPVFNPNPLPVGVWSYGYYNFPLVPASNPCFLLTLPGPISGVDAWRAPAFGEVGVYHNPSAAAVSFITASDNAIYQPGQLGMHPGPNDQYGVVQFTVPANGLYTIHGTFVGLDPGTNTLADLLRNNVPVFFPPKNVAFGVPVPLSFGPVLLNAGDTLSFAAGGNYAFGSTGLLPNAGVDLDAAGAIWNVDSSGNWNTAANWLGGGVPSGTNASAILGSLITGPRLIYTENTPITLGTLTFDSSNSYAIAGVGSSGMLTMAASSDAAINVFLGSHKIDLPLSFNSNTTISLASGTTLEIANPITLNGQTVSVTGGGNLMLDVNFSASGGTLTASAGIVQVGSQAVIRPASLALTGSAQLAGAGEILGANLTYGSSATGTFAGSIVGSSALLLDGPGTLILSGSNTYTGGTTISGGTLTIGNAGSLGSGGVYAGNIAIGNSAVFNYSGSSAQTLSGIISGNGSLVKGGTGTLTIANVNSFGGGDANGDVFGIASIHQGEIHVSAGGVLTNNTSEIDIGDTAGLTGILTMSGGSAMTPWGSSGKSGVNVGVNGGTGVVTLSGSALLDASCTANSNGGANGSYSNVVAIGLASSLGTVTVEDAARLRSVQGTPVSNGSFISVGDGGVGTLTIRDQAQVQAANFKLGGTFYGVSGGTGSLYLDGGTLSVPRIVNDSGTTGNLYFNGGVLQASASSSDFLSGSGTLSTYVQAGGAVIDSNGYNITIRQALLHDRSGPTTDGGLTKVGAGTLILTTANSYSGGTTVEDGTLAISTAAALPTGTSLTVGAGGVFIFDPAYVSAGPAASAGAVSAVPEPGTLALLAAATLVAFAVRNGRKSWCNRNR